MSDETSDVPCILPDSVFRIRLEVRVAYASRSTIRLLSYRRAYPGEFSCLLNAQATRICELVDGRRPVKSLVEEAQHEFGLALDVATREVVGLVSVLLAQDFVEPVP